ncbi:MAG: GTPase HflX [Bacteroidales bacterium]|nr:GTPase HflX [Bacteroidales bacterium]
MQQIRKEEYREKAVLIAVSTPDVSDAKTKEYLEELAFLVETAGGECVKKYVQNLQHPDTRTYFGSGKMAEVADFVRENDVDMIVVDDELPPSQQRNIEQIAKCKVMDRTHLILDIFAKHAKTAHAKTQVELAQYKYLLPRLTGMWTHLEKQRGGIGMRGPGEKEIETDRRIIRNRISLLESRLKEIDKQKRTQRGHREQFVRVALVGYTNVGKSTIMNILSNSEVLAENKLFATLDTTVRKVVFQNLPFLLADTVGFIRKLPHSLVESFKSTLDEIRETHLLLHVVDISHPDFEEQIQIVQKTLAEIDAGDKPTVIIFNKIDQYSWVEKAEDDLTPRTKENVSLDELKATWMAKCGPKTLFISAKTKENIAEMRDFLYEEIKKLHIQIYPYNNFLY